MEKFFFISGLYYCRFVKCLFVSIAAKTEQNNTLTPQKSKNSNWKPLANFLQWCKWCKWCKFRDFFKQILSLRNKLSLDFLRLQKLAVITWKKGTWQIQTFWFVTLTVDYTILFSQKMTNVMANSNCFSFDFLLELKDLKCDLCSSSPSEQSRIETLKKVVKYVQS